MISNKIEDDREGSADKDMKRSGRGRHLPGDTEESES
jgi:hypothetical protein